MPLHWFVANAPEKAGRFHLPLHWVVANALEKRADFICPYNGSQLKSLFVQTRSNRLNSVLRLGQPKSEGLMGRQGEKSFAVSVNRPLSQQMPIKPSFVLWLQSQQLSNDLVNFIQFSFQHLPNDIAQPANGLRKEFGIGVHHHLCNFFMTLFA